MKLINVSVVSPLMAPPEGTVLAIFAAERNYSPEYDSSKILKAAMRYAKKYGVFTVPERFVAGGFLCLCLISPNGELIGVQQACHLNMDYRGVFRRCNEITVFDTEIGKLALFVDVDINKSQVVKQASEKGAELIISSQFIQLFDFYSERVQQAALNISSSCNLSMVSAVSAGAFAMNYDGKVVCEFTEFLPQTLTLSLDGKIDPYLLSREKQLLAMHSDKLIYERQE